MKDQSINPHILNPRYLLWYRQKGKAIWSLKIKSNNFGDVVHLSSELMKSGYAVRIDDTKASRYPL